MNQLEESIDLGNVDNWNGNADQPLTPRSRSRLQVNSFQKPQRKQRPAPAAVGAAIHATFDRLNAHETDIEAIKSRLKGNLPPEGEDELKQIKRKLRSVVETTSSACHTVSSSVSDVQDATVQIYTWAERVHTAMGVLSEKVGVRPNVCPRLQIVPGLEPRAAAPVLNNYVDGGATGYLSPSRHTPSRHGHHQSHHPHHHHHHHSSSHGHSNRYDYDNY
jgi:gas vesicle protein